MDEFLEQIKGLKYIELFGGIGGFRLALDWIGCECVWCCEKDKNCRLTYSANFGKEPYYDVTKASLDHIPSFDILTAGFPCQDFSTLGEQEGLDGKHGSLFFEVVKFLKHFEPEYFLLENVKGLQTMNDGKTFDYVLKTLKECGYSVNFKIINSSTLLPQFRNRLYIIGSRSVSLETFAMLPIENVKAIKLQSVFDNDNPFLPYYKLSLEKWKNVKRSRRVKVSGNEALVKRFICKDDIIVDTLISNYRNSLKNVAQFVTPLSRAELLSRLESNQNRDTSEEFRPRWLTPREMCKLMGFPANFIHHPNEIICSQQFGNAVTPPVIIWIAVSLLFFCYSPSDIKKIDLIERLLEKYLDSICPTTT